MLDPLNTSPNWPFFSLFVCLAVRILGAHRALTDSVIFGYYGALARTAASVQLNDFARLFCLLARSSTQYDCVIFVCVCARNGFSTLRRSNWYWFNGWRARARWRWPRLTFHPDLNWFWVICLAQLQNCPQLSVQSTFRGWTTFTVDASETMMRLAERV